MLTLPEIRTEVERLAAVISAPADMLPTYGFSRDMAYPHVDVDARHYYYIVVERGEELERFRTRELDELLEKIFANITSWMSFEYEREHRDHEKDCRRIAFAHQIELLARLSARWAARKCADHLDILRQHPFDDTATQALRAGQV